MRMLDGMTPTSPLIQATRMGKAFKRRYFTRLWDPAMLEAGIPRSARDELNGAPERILNL